MISLSWALEELNNVSNVLFSHKTECKIETENFRDSSWVCFYISLKFMSKIKHECRSNWIWMPNKNDYFTEFLYFKLFITRFLVSTPQYKVCVFWNSGRVGFTKEFAACFLHNYVWIIYLKSWLIQILFQPPLISSPMNMVRSNKIDKQLQTRNKTTPKVTNICIANCRILLVKLGFMPNVLAGCIPCWTILRIFALFFVLWVHILCFHRYQANLMKMTNFLRN